MLFKKLEKLEDDLVNASLHLEENFYPNLLTIVASRRWLLSHGFKLFITKSLNCREYLEALGAVISRATEKGMQMGLKAGIEHGKKGYKLEQLVAYKSSAEEDYNAAIKDLRDLDFPLVAQLNALRDASMDDIMDLLRLDEPLARLPGMNELQPNTDQLTVPIHREVDQTIIGARALTLSIGFSRSRVERIRRDLAERKVVLNEVFASLFGSTLHEYSVDEAGPSTSVQEVPSTTTLSTTFAAVAPIPSVSVEDYVVPDGDDRSQTRGEGETSTGEAMNRELTEEDFNFSA